jgi:signal peptidase I
MYQERAVSMFTRDCPSWICKKSHWEQNMKVLTKAISAISTLAVIILVFLAFGSVNNRWYRVITIEGDSMSPTLWIGDMIVVTPATQAIPVNTIVVMKIAGSLVTHRLVGFDPAGRPITKGDANEVVDNFQNPDQQIIGIYRFRLPGFGYPFLVFQYLLSRV